MIKENLKQQAYQLLKTKILTCEYGPGTSLTEAFLIEDTGLSRTPIKDALSRLEQEQLIIILPKKGIQVSAVEINEINMIYETRNLIEPYIIRKYGLTIPRDALTELKASFKEMPVKISEDGTKTELDKYKAYGYDDSFHKLIVASSKNIHLTFATEHTNNQNTRLRALTGVDEARLQASNPEHIRIIEKLLEGDAPGAAIAMEEHLRLFKEASFKAIIENGGWKLN